MNEVSVTKVVVPCRFSYAHVFQAYANDEKKEAKFSVSCIIPKSDKATIKKIKDAIKTAYDAGVASKFGGKRPATWRNPLHDGDEEKPEDDAYQNSVYFNASCSTRPGIVDINRQLITNEEEFYSGCYGLVSVNFYAFNKNGVGVAAGLNNVMKVKEGEPLGGRVSAEADFEKINPDDYEFSDDDLG